jgi:hypothetical protein
MFGEELDWNDGKRPRVWNTQAERWENWGDAFWVLVRLGWESLGPEERQQILLDSDAVALWLDPERYPF